MCEKGAAGHAIEIHLPLDGNPVLQLPELDGLSSGVLHRLHERHHVNVLQVAVVHHALQLEELLGHGPEVVAKFRVDAFLQVWRQVRLKA